MIGLTNPVQDAGLLEPLVDGLNALLNIEVSLILGLLGFVA